MISLRLDDLPLNICSSLLKLYSRLTIIFYIYTDVNGDKRVNQEWKLFLIFHSVFRRKWIFLNEQKTILRHFLVKYYSHLLNAIYVTRKYYWATSKLLKHSKVCDFIWIDQKFKQLQIVRIKQMISDTAFLNTINPNNLLQILEKVILSTVIS